MGFTMHQNLTTLSGIVEETGIFLLYITYVSVKNFPKFCFKSNLKVSYSFWNIPLNSQLIIQKILKSFLIDQMKNRLKIHPIIQ
jgi:hypothetical protein